MKGLSDEKSEARKERTLSDAEKKKNGSIESNSDRGKNGENERLIDFNDLSTVTQRVTVRVTSMDQIDLFVNCLY